MSNKKFMAIVAFAVTLACGVNTAYTVGKKSSYSGKGPVSSLPAKDTPLCPSCREVRLSPVKRMALVTIPMVCPNCKNVITEIAVHRCDKCGEDILACVLCQKASDGLKASTMISKCPRCKLIRSRLITGKALAKWKMKCQNCKHKLQEWFIQHCNTCDTDFLSCPNCKKEQERFQK
ncbi:MAG: hypothetical protein HRF42_00160 [Candidatus Brocadia sp.]|jgi:hypothetical protein